MDEIGVNAATTAITVLGRGTIATVVAVPLGPAAPPPARHARPRSGD